jgi:hypothetical protein
LIENDESTVRYIQVYTVSVKDHGLFSQKYQCNIFFTNSYSFSESIPLFQAVMEAHETRAKALTGLKSKFHTARPWQKKIDNNLDSSKSSTIRNAAESSEEEMEQVCEGAVFI